MGDSKVMGGRDNGKGGRGGRGRGEVLTGGGGEQSKKGKGVRGEDGAESRKG